MPRLSRTLAPLGALALGLLGACAIEAPTSPGPEPAPIIALSVAPAADSAGR